MSPANKFQRSYVKSLNIIMKKPLVREELMSTIPDIPTYRVYSAFRKAVLSRMQFKDLRPIQPDVVNHLVSALKGNVSDRNNISNYVAAVGLGFIDSMIVAYRLHSEYLTTQFLWRAFYYQADIHDPVLRSYKWKINKTHQELFFQGKTGYKLIDAANTYLRSTGKLDNRMRMIVASFFCKNLLQPWMDGAEFFKKYLEDYDEVLNTGNWIWCSQIRYDNQQFVRFFHPDLQLKKLLKTSSGIAWYNEWKQPDYQPIINWEDSCLRYREWRRKK